MIGDSLIEVLMILLMDDGDENVSPVLQCAGVLYTERPPPRDYNQLKDR